MEPDLGYYLQKYKESAELVAKLDGNYDVEICQAILDIAHERLRDIGSKIKRDSGYDD